jgi:N-glycosylase/DNA lyase
MDSTESLISEYRIKKNKIKQRLKDFRSLDKNDNKQIVPELCFCLLTPQSNARHCDKAIRELKDRGLIFKGSASSIRPILKGRARFHNKKADYIVGARACFDKSIFKMSGAAHAREALVRNIKGLGYKEASHFLRNIGMGRDIAILDRHILKNLKNYGAIDKVPASLTKSSYLDIEERARRFAKRIKIPLEELDLLFWSKETGAIFK